MFGRTETPTTTYPEARSTEVVIVDPALANGVVARGRLSLSSVLTGVVVAFGAMFLLAAIVAGVITTAGLAEPGAIEGQTIEVGLGAGFILVIAEFLAYLWGGYTAGRMGRGAGVANGLSVALTAMVMTGIVAGIVALLGETSSLNLPFTTTRLPVESDFLIQAGVIIGIASLIAMFMGSILGGVLGARWHTRLERTVYEQELERLSTNREVDLRDSDEPVTTTSRTATMRRVPSDETPISTGPTFRTGT